MKPKPLLYFICNGIKPKALSTFVHLKLIILCTLILISAACEVSFAFQKKCSELFQENQIKDFNVQTLLEKIGTLELTFARKQAEALAEKTSLIALQSVEPRIDSIVSNASKNYVQGFYEVPGLPSRQLNNAEISEQVTLAINSSQTWKQKISKTEVEALLYYANAVHLGAPDTSYIALLFRYQGMYKGDAPDMRLVNLAEQLLKKDSDLQKLDSVIKKSTYAAATPAARKYRSSEEAEAALIELAFSVIASAGIPKTLLKPYLELTRKYSDEGGPYSIDKGTYDQLTKLLNASLVNEEITQEVYIDLKDNLWMYGQSPNDLFRTYQRKAPKSFRTLESELRNVIQTLKDVESVHSLVGR